MVKTQWIKRGLLLSTLFTVSPAHADLMDGLGAWRGSGSSFSPEGALRGDFKVELMRTAVGASSVETRGKVTLGSGQVVPIEQRVTLTGSGFTTQSARGQGNGHCFGADLCHVTEDKGGGKSSAMTIIIDAPDRIRILITELDQGKPVEFIRQTLERK